jgi:protein-L-isoaspartate O-methyltransferase
MHRTHADLIQSLVRQNIIKNERIKTAMLATDRLDFSTDRLYEDAPQPSNILLVVFENNFRNIYISFFQLVIM